MKRSLLLPSAAGLLVLGLSGCADLVCRDSQARDSRRLWRQRTSTLTNPLLDVDSSIRFVELRPFERDLSRLVDDIKREGRASEVAVYFRDMNNGYWTGIGENSRFTPASLLKVPLAMAYLKQAEVEPSILASRIVFDTSAIANVLPQAFKPQASLEPGKSYSVEELLSGMLAQSDNDEAQLLLGHADPKAFQDTFTDLGLGSIDLRHPEYSLSVKEYSTFFRILYNASYLDRRMSEKALSFLTQTVFSRGIVAGVAPGTTVAHKFGERATTDVPPKLQLHDCGIIYHPRTPYLLCVMTRGSDFERLADVIRDVSRFAYEQVDRSTASGLSP